MQQRDPGSSVLWTAKTDDIQRQFCFVLFRFAFLPAHHLKQSNWREWGRERAKINNMKPVVWPISVPMILNFKCMAFASVFVVCMFYKLSFYFNIFITTGPKIISLEIEMGCSFSHSLRCTVWLSIYRCFYFVCFLKLLLSLECSVFVHESTLSKIPTDITKTKVLLLQHVSNGELSPFETIFSSQIARQFQVRSRRLP